MRERKPVNLGNGIYWTPSDRAQRALDRDRARRMVRYPFDRFLMQGYPGAEVYYRPAALANPTTGER